MFFSSLNQFYIFLAFLFLGLWAGFFWSLIRTLVGKNAIALNIIAVFFWPILTICFYFFAVKANFGLIRAYMIVICTLGFLISYKLFASLLAKCFGKVYNCIIKLKGGRRERKESKTNI